MSGSTVETDGGKPGLVADDVARKLSLSEFFWWVVSLRKEESSSGEKRDKTVLEGSFLQVGGMIQ